MEALHYNSAFFIFCPKVVTKIYLMCNQYCHSIAAVFSCMVMAACRFSLHKVLVLDYIFHILADLDTSSSCKQLTIAETRMTMHIYSSNTHLSPQSLSLFIEIRIERV